MNESEMKRMIAAELKEMRKGRGFDEYVSSNDGAHSMLLIATFGNQAELRDIMTRELTTADAIDTGNTQFSALMHALALNAPPTGNDLTSRRKAFSRDSGLSERTLFRYENGGIDRLARRLTAVILDNNDYRANVEEWYRAASQPELDILAIGKSSSAVDILAVQDRMIERLSEAVESLSDQLDDLRKTNARLARMLGGK